MYSFNDEMGEDRDGNAREVRGLKWHGLSQSQTGLLQSIDLSNKNTDTDSSHSRSEESKSTDDEKDLECDISTLDLLLNVAGDCTQEIEDGNHSSPDVLNSRLNTALNHTSRSNEEKKEDIEEEERIEKDKNKINNFKKDKNKKKNYKLSMELNNNYQKMSGGTKISSMMLSEPNERKGSSIQSDSSIDDDKEDGGNKSITSSSDSSSETFDVLKTTTSSLPFLTPQKSQTTSRKIQKSRRQGETTDGNVVNKTIKGGIKKKNDKNATKCQFPINRFYNKVSKTMYKVDGVKIKSTSGFKKAFVKMLELYFLDLSEKILLGKQEGKAQLIADFVTQFAYADDNSNEQYLSDETINDHSKWDSNTLSNYNELDTSFRNITRSDVKQALVRSDYCKDYFKNKEILFGRSHLKAIPKSRKEIMSDYQRIKKIKVGEQDDSGDYVSISKALNKAKLRTGGSKRRNVKRKRSQNPNDSTPEVKRNKMPKK